MVFEFKEENGKFLLKKGSVTILQFEERDNVVSICNGKGVALLSASLSGQTETKITVNTDNIADGAITNAKLAPGVGQGGASSIAVNSISGSKLNANVADGTTIEYNNINNHLEIKDGGVGYAKLSLTHDISGNDLSNTVADGTTIEYNNINNHLEIKDGGVGYAKLSLTHDISGNDLSNTVADGTTIEYDNTNKNLGIKNGGVTYAKLSLTNDISGSDLSNTVADGTSIEYDTTNKNLGIKFHNVANDTALSGLANGTFYKATGAIGAFKDQSGVAGNYTIPNGTFGMKKIDFPAIATDAQLGVHFN